MKLQILRANRMALLAGYLAFAVTILAPPATLAQTAFPVSPSWIESLCPTPDGTGFVIGAIEEDQPETAMELLQTPGKMRAPFTGGSIVSTPWSGRLAGLSWESDLEIGNDMQLWRDALSSALEDDGWSWRGETEFGLLPDWESVAYEKAVVVDGVERTLIFRFYAHDKYAADCGDSDQLALFQREVVGDLEPDSPKPVDPGPPIDEALFFARFDCSDADLIAAFGKAETVTVAGPLAESRISGDLPYEAQENYGKRLGKWLEWKLMSSGKLEPEDIDSVYNEADPGVELDFEESFVEIVDGMEAVFEGLDEGNGAKTCSGYRAVLQTSIDKTKAQAERHRRLNVALVALAERLGVDID